MEETRQIPDVVKLNAWSISDAHSALLRCCGSRQWVRAMVLRRPFADGADALTAASEIWRGLTRDDWLEAFASHPRIGSLDILRTKFAATTRWEFEEQAGVAGAGDAVLHALAAANRKYEAKFGYIFIVFATGKSAKDMLALLEARIQNDPDAELSVAAAEQEKITQLRLQKL